MPFKSHPTDPDKMVYVSQHYDIPQLQGVTTPQRPSEVTNYAHLLMVKCFNEKYDEHLEKNMTGYVSKKMLGAARLPDTPSARAYLDKVLDDDDTQVYKRSWVGLSSVDFNDFNPLFTAEEAARWAEAKLKEKNT
jgi:hypothetical protein